MLTLPSKERNEGKWMPNQSSGNGFQNTQNGFFVALSIMAIIQKSFFPRIWTVLTLRFTIAETCNNIKNVERYHTNFAVSSPHHCASFDAFASNFQRYLIESKLQEVKKGLGFLVDNSILSRIERLLLSSLSWVLRILHFQKQCS